MKNHIATSLFEYLDKQNQNDNFWNWFDGSTTIDDNGKPIVFYHGSNKNFKIFNDDKPIWFTKYDEYAKACISGTGKLYSVYLKIKNPLYIGYIDGIANKNSVKYLSELTDIDINILSDILKNTNDVNIFNITNSTTFKHIVSNKGYDGLVAKEAGLTTYAVFNSNQIKSIKNNGNWNNNNNNINS